MRHSAIFAIALVGCFDPHLDPCAIEGACPDGTRVGNDALPGTNDARSDAAPGSSDAENVPDGAERVWNGTYAVSLTYVSPPTGCVFFPSVVLAVDPGTGDQAHWYGGGTGVAYLWYADGLDQVKFENFTDTSDVIHAEWIGTRDVSGVITGSFSGSDSCNYGVELVRE